MTRRMTMDIRAVESASSPVKLSQDDMSMMPTKEIAGLQYSLLSNDVCIKSGRYAGRKASELLSTVEGRDYIGQMWKIANAEIRAVLRQFFSE